LYLEIAAEQGVVGLALFGGLIVASLSLARTATSRLVADGNPEVALTVQGLMLGLVGYLLTAVFLHDAYPRPFWVLLALVVASRSASRRLTLQNPLRTEEPAVAS
jgi:O-antigen ligase